LDLKARNGSSFHLELVGYEYPQIYLDRWDSNWLRIYMAVTLPEGSWSITFPFLLTFEVEHLADWFDAVAVHTQSENEIGFTEPNLSFDVIETTQGALSLRIHFAIECLPPWVDRTKHGTEDVFADFSLSEIDLRAAAEALRSQLKLYPQRAAG
jgi:hypothetical protein